jgi:phytoene dehydrogenase-like protein
VKYDAIVIGGGHNGLTCAAYLARAGRRVLVLERRHVLGGAAVTEEVFPGFRFSVCSYVVSLLRPEIIRDLDLPRHGMELLPLDGTFTPLPDGDYLWRVNDHEKTRREIARHSRLDAEAYDEYGRAMVEMGRFAKPILSLTPPDPTSLDPRGLLELLAIGRRFRGMRAHDRVNQVQLLTMSAVDFLDQWFETDVLKATMSASGIIGTFLGVRSPGTAYVLLHHYMGEIDGAFRSWGLSRGGTGAVSEAIGAAAREHGAEIRTRAAVGRIRTRNGRATGVALENGDELHAEVVVSSVDPRHTFLRWLDERELPDDFVEGVRRYKFRGSSGKVNLALDRLPDFTCLPGAGPHLRGAISISPSVDYMERAYDDAKYGAFSRRPYIDIVIPSLTDPSVAPPGKHVMSCFVQYAPYELRRDSGEPRREREEPRREGEDTRRETNERHEWDRQREAFGDAVIDTIAQYAPNIRDSILHRQVLTPLDIERDFGLSEGNIFQGELTLEQLFFLRPVPGWARYATPIRGLYLCGSAAHPGGGIMGAPGKNAAEAILKA